MAAEGLRPPEPILRPWIASNLAPVDTALCCALPYQQRCCPEEASLPSAARRVQEDDELLSMIFHYVGPCQFLFVASTCKRWRRLYTHTNDTSASYASYAVASVPLLEEAARAGLDIRRSSRTAGYHASTQVLSWAKKHGIVPAEAALGAAAAGRLEVLRWVHKGIWFGWTIPCLMSEGRVALVAAMHGQVEVLEWLWRSRGGSFMRDMGIGDMAAMTGEVAVLEWARPRVLDDSRLPRIRDTAALFQQAEALEWATENGAPLSASTFTNALTSGNLEFCKWLQVQGCPFDLTDACLGAAFSGSIDMVRWVRGIAGEEWSVEHLGMLLLASGYLGQLRVFKWARSHGAPWLPAAFMSSNPTAGGVGGGSGRYCRIWRAPVLQWALQHGCPWGAWTSEVCTQLRRAGDYDRELDWAHANGCPCQCQS